jgi:hypothetical protein
MVILASFLKPKYLSDLRLYCLDKAMRSAVCILYIHLAKTHIVDC